MLSPNNCASNLIIFWTLLAELQLQNKKLGFFLPIPGHMSAHLTIGVLWALVYDLSNLIFLREIVAEFRFKLRKAICAALKYW